MKKLGIWGIALLLIGCATTSPNSQTATDVHEIAINDSKLAQSAAENAKTDANIPSPKFSESMMIPAEAQKTKSGYAYVSLKTGSDQKPASTDAVKVFLRVLNIEGTLVDEGETILAMSHSTPFLEEMLSVMSIGEQIRVWGESQARIWEIELLAVDTSFQAPEDVASPPETAQILTGFEDVRWRVVEEGTGDNVRTGQAYRIHASRWNAQGEILESSKNGRGMLLMLNDEYAAQDPLHAAILPQMRPGMKVRLWIPAARVGTPTDLVEDFWIVERLTQLEPPQNMTPPLNDPNLIVITPDQAWMQIEVNSNAPKLTDQTAVTVDMTCWNAETQKLIDASYLREKPDIMDIRPELGIWHTIMTQASIGTTFVAWIKKDALPENVGMDMTCRVQILESAETHETTAPQTTDNTASSKENP